MKKQALLILGPTGSGKTPLGEYIARHGIKGHKYVHFDFSAELQRISKTRHSPISLDAADCQIIEDVLRRGVLFKDSQFHIVLAIVKDFLNRHDQECHYVLNGLLRHLGQARKIDHLFNIAKN